ncbi:MAG: BglG family transcription antiterminator LicT [Enterobacteriaceae bacterium]
MNIHKILNNNVVIILDDKQREVILMGRGLGFKKRPGEAVDPELIEKQFVLQDDEHNERYKLLLSELPHECLLVAEKIVELATQQGLGKLHTSLRISLMDHIHFAAERHKEGIDIKNVLLWEIKRAYPKEYAIGLQGLEIIARELQVQLPEDEAGFIALHLVNAQLDDNMQNTMQITQVMQEILQLVKQTFSLEYDEESFSYHRFVTHLKFFAHRLLGKNSVTSDDDSLYLAVKAKYVNSFQCVELVAEHMQQQYQHSMSTEEMMFLTIHIERVRSESR